MNDKNNFAYLIPVSLQKNIQYVFTSTLLINA